MNATANFAATVEPISTSPEAWVDAHGGYLFNFAIGQVLDVSVAEDLVQ